MVQASDFAGSIVVVWCQYQSTKQDNYDEGGGNISSPYAEPGAIMIRVKEWPLAGITHVEAIVRPSELMNELA
jgi:hypothetical protein